MANHLATIYGTEKDKEHCSFYLKIGACRHGDRCTRMHPKPVDSNTILLKNMYFSLDHVLEAAKLANITPLPKFCKEDFKYHFEDFYEDTFVEMSKFGHVREMIVCMNMSAHLNGNVYVKFEDNLAAQQALDAMSDRYYAGRPVVAELCPVTEFRDARCRPYEKNRCDRGDFCNFMHVNNISRALEERLFGDSHKDIDRDKKKRRSRDSKDVAPRMHKRASGSGGGKDFVDFRGRDDQDDYDRDAAGLGPSGRKRLRSPRSPEYHAISRGSHASRERDRDRRRDYDRDYDRDTSIQRYRHGGSRSESEEDLRKLVRAPPSNEHSMDRRPLGRDRDRDRERDRDYYDGDRNHVDRDKYIKRKRLD
eukprot:CAMPEP_0184706270 /NCGR_PEP_ID=MMETSP0313-20130426/36671_1 /TAXON_ID=2792 /ORGANISM="Porphyridium aerugineum, Strain SAG 1380-2" /LENGTH=363 /DNA_ID=CAMNT_0027167819 /DNA_START=121 /DNA_END=1212 /DNA_ORIENTATION=-